ncbi:nuclear transport factor 2 like export factor 2, partial [Chelydra serpentina]
GTLVEGHIRFLLIAEVSASERAAPALSSATGLGRGSPFAACMAASVNFKTYVDQTCRAAEEFVNIYYDTMDKRRRVEGQSSMDIESGKGCFPGVGMGFGKNHREFREVES